MIESTIILSSQETWPKGKTIEDIIKELDAMVQFPGVTNAWTMPIKTRIDMLATGIKTPVGIKLMWYDLKVLSEVGERIEAVVSELPETLSAYSERVVGGNYMERANKRLSILIPLTLAIIFLLLYIHFRNMTESLIVMLTLPFALVGGVWLMWVFGYNTSVAVAVGFIALAGLAAETGVVMLVYLDEVYERFKKEGRLKSLADLKTVIIEGAVDRVRPKLMTVATTIIGLLPIMFGTETGTGVMKRITAPMIGGLISSTVLTLVIIPAIYLLWKQIEHRKDLAPAEASENANDNPDVSD